MEQGELNLVKEFQAQRANRPTSHLNVKPTCLHHASDLKATQNDAVLTSDETKRQTLSFIERIVKRDLCVRLCYPPNQATTSNPQPKHALISIAYW
jgi:hypothetical protein